MNRLIIIDDKHCREELDVLLNKHEADVLLNMETRNMDIPLETMLDGFKEVQAEIKEITIHNPEISQKVKARDVIFIRTDGEKLEFKLKGQITLSGLGKLDDYRRELTGFSFYSLGRNALINIRTVETILFREKAYVVMHNGYHMEVDEKPALELLKYLETNAV